MVLIRSGPLPNDPSVESVTRVRKTHKDAQTIARIQKLPIESKLKLNLAKQDRNAARRERALADDDALVSDASSYISIPEEEFEKMARDNTYFDRMKPYLSGHTLSWLSEKRKSLRSRPREGDDVTSATNTAPAKCFRPNKPLIDVDPSLPPNISLDDAYLPIGIFGFHIPLALFTNKNVKFLNNVAVSIHRVKLTHLEDKPQVPEVSDMIKLIKASPDGGTTEDLELEYYEWLEATNNFYDYESRLCIEGDASHEAQFYKKHFGFFENQPESFKLFHLWKDLELELHRKHQTQNTAFDSIEY